MALGPDRSPDFGETDISFFMNSVAERGGVVVAVSGGSGANMDCGNNLVIYTGSPSGKVPLGVLMNDMVNVDLTRYHLNHYKDEVQYGGKVNIKRKGWVVTNMVKSGDTPALGNPLYLAPDGRVSTTNLGSIASPKVGMALGSLNQDGYVKYSFNFENNNI